MLKKILPYLVILVAILIFFWPNFFWPAVDITPSVGTNDFTDGFYPIRAFSIQSFKNLHWPIWMSQISGGYPFSLYTFYPLNILSYFLPLNLSLDFSILSSYLLLGVAGFLLLQELKLSRPAALFGALNLTFCGFAVARILYLDMVTAFSYLIWELFLWERFFRKKQFIYLILAALVLGLQILGGHPQIIFYSLIFLALYWLFLTLIFRASLLKGILLFSLFILVGLGIGAGQLLPQWEFTRNSDRTGGLSETAIARFNFPAKDLVTFVFPYASYDSSQTLEAFHRNGWPQDERYTYLGILALALALLAVLTQFRKNPRVLFFTATLIFFLLLSFGTGSVFGFFLTQPPLNLFRLPLRFLMLVDVSLVILAAFGFEAVLKWLGRLSKREMGVMGVAALLITLSFLDLWYWGSKLHPAVRTNDWYRTPETVKFLKKHLQNQERVTTEHYYYSTVKIFLTQRHLWDDYRIFINLRNLLPPFNNLLYDIPMAVGAANSAGLKVDRYNDLEMETYFNGFNYSSFDKVTVADSYLFLNRLLGVRYVLTTKELPSGLGLSRVFKTDFQNGQDNVNVYEFFDYYPRTFMIPKAQIEKPEKIKEHLLKMDFDPKQTIFLEEETNWGAQGAMAASAQFEKYEDQEVKIKTQSSADGFLFLSDTYYPDWKAYVDGKEKKIYLANYAFRAVEVPQGEHEVVFQYEPKSFWWGIRISLGVGGLVVLGIVALGLREVWRRRK